MDQHAKDALAAAVTAYKHNKDHINNIKATIAEKGVEEHEDEIIQQTYTSSRSLQQIIASFTQEEQTQTTNTSPTQINWEKTAKEYRKQLKQKKKENERLRSYNKELKNTVKRLETEIDDLQEKNRQKALETDLVQQWKQRAENKDKQLRKTKNKIRELENTLKRHKNALKYIHKGENIFKICESREELKKIDDNICFVRKHLQVEPPPPLQAVIVENEEDAQFYSSHDVATINYRDLKGLKLDDFYIVDRDKVINKLHETSEAFISWLEEYRERQ